MYFLYTIKILSVASYLLVDIQWLVVILIIFLKGYGMKMYAKFALLSALIAQGTLQADEPKKFTVSFNDQTFDSNSITEETKKTALAGTLGGLTGICLGALAYDMVYKKPSFPGFLFIGLFGTAANIVGKNIVTDSIGAEYVEVAAQSEAIAGGVTLLGSMLLRK